MRRISDLIFEHTRTDELSIEKCVELGEIIEKALCLNTVKDLDEAAKEYTYGDLSEEERKEVECVADSLIDAFKAGAEWAMEQGVKTTGTISPRGIIYDTNVGYHLFLERYHNGDKVEIQIRKKEDK